MKVSENGFVRYLIVRWLVFILTVLGSFFVNAQEIYKPVYFTFSGKFSVLETNVLEEMHCYEKIRVTWQIHNQNMYFIINDRILKMYPLNKKKNKKRFKKKCIRRDIEYINKYNLLANRTTFIYLMENERAEIYYIVFSMPTKHNPGFSIYICDMEKRYPNYLLIFDVNVLICK